MIDTFLENAYKLDRKLMLDRNELAAYLPDHDLQVVKLYRAIRPQSSVVFNAGSYLYFERAAMRSMYEAGKAAATDWLTRGPVLDDRQREG